MGPRPSQERARRGRCPRSGHGSASWGRGPGTQGVSAPPLSPLEAPALTEDASGVKGPSGPEDADAPAAPFIAVQPFPALLDLPAGSEAAAASCGSRHTAVVTRTGELYTWGWGKYGQLGHGDTASWDRPRRVESFVGQRLHVTAVHCGPWNTYVRAEGPGQPEGS